MVEIDDLAYRLLTKPNCDTVEFDGWRVEEWGMGYGGMVVAYERDGDEWIASHYYRPDELRKEGPDAQRLAYTAGETA